MRKSGVQGIIGREQTIPVQKCPGCNHRVSGGSTVTAPGDPDHAITPGSISVCGYCAAIAIYDDDLMMRKLTDAEWADLKLDPDFPRLMSMQQAIRKAKGMNGDLQDPTPLN